MNRCVIAIVLVSLAMVGGCKPKLAHGAEMEKFAMSVVPVEHTVKFKGAGGFELEGTLMVPAGKQDAVYPAVLLLPGSGPTDRDGNQPSLKTDVLKQIAVALAKTGIVTFRFDKRAVAKYAAQWPKKPEDFGPWFSWDNHIADGMAAYKAMRDSVQVDKKNCAILGHSEGGSIALAMSPRARPQVLILIGTIARPIDVVIHDQLSRNLAPLKNGKELLAANDRISKEIQRTGQNPPDVPTELKSLYNPSVGIYLQQLMALRPLELLQKFQGSVLVMNGESDVQVDPKLDAQVLSDVSPKTKESRLFVVPLASHCLKAVKKPGDDPYGGDVVPDALEAIQRFCVDTIGGKMPEGSGE